MQLTLKISRFDKIESLQEEDFVRSFDTNVKGVWLWARQVLPAMKRQRRGQLVFVSSIAGIRKLANCSIYGASKWAVQGMAGSLREECRGTGVKIATLCPGSVATPWWLERERGGKDVPATEEQMAKMLTPDDVASAAMTIVDQVFAIVAPPPHGRRPQTIQHAYRYSSGAHGFASSTRLSVFIRRA